MNETENGSTGSSGHDPAADAAPTGGAADETFGWTAPDEEAAASGSDARATAERMLSQLQSMIDTVAVQAAPVVRQIGAKAAELAAVAADRAGPLVHRAADATADASERLAERSRTWAADLRSKADDAAGGTTAGGTTAGGSADGSAAGISTDPTPTGSATTVAEPADAAGEAIEDAPADQPAEGGPA